jgi:3-hydroxyisobutyrate dehydrogenase-like beta-hydroxyacid dehydrogenase
MGERVAVLGTEIMGAPMARNLLKAGFHVRVWNRSPDKARVLAADGADLAETPADAVGEAAFVITMLTGRCRTAPSGSRPAWTLTWSARPGSRRITGSRS